MGCLRFAGLIDAGVKPPGPDQVLKTLVSVQIDPIRPFDPKRTRQIFGGRNYVLGQSGSSYWIAPAS